MHSPEKRARGLVYASDEGKRWTPRHTHSDDASLHLVRNDTILQLEGVAVLLRGVSNPSRGALLMKMGV